MELINTQAESKQRNEESGEVVLGVVFGLSVGFSLGPSALGAALGARALSKRKRYSFGPISSGFSFGVAACGLIWVFGILALAALNLELEGAGVLVMVAACDVALGVGVGALFAAWTKGKSTFGHYLGAYIVIHLIHVLAFVAATSL